MKYDKEPKILHLLQHIPYRRCESSPTDIGRAYGTLLSRTDGGGTGGEGCLFVSSLMTVLDAGYRAPLSPAEKERAERGEGEPFSDGDFSIRAGDYAFVQLEETPSEETIAPLLERYAARLACDGASGLYVRIVRENVLETVVQLLWPR